MVNQSIPGAWDLGSVETEPVGGMLPSRLEAFTSCLQGLRGPFATAVLTGDSGSGKSWLVNRIVEQAIPSTRWVRVTLLPSQQPIDFYHELLLNCGESPCRRLSEMRTRLRDFLGDQATNAMSWALCVEDLHHVSSELLAELQLVCRQLARPGQFRALMLAGNTVLTRMIRTRSFDGLISRVGRWAHLRPIDADEAQELLLQQRDGTHWSIEIAENLHRDSRGNPLLLLKLADAYKQRANLTPRTEPIPTETERYPGTNPRIASYPLAHAAPLLGSSKPPLRVEDGLIEVGYSADPSETRATHSTAESREARVVPSLAPTPQESSLAPSRDDQPTSQAGDDGEPADPPTELEEEIVRDSYAAIQAWNEWSMHDEGLAASSVAHENSPAGAKLDSGRNRENVIELGPNLWLEEQHDSFAPYSQLFARGRPSKSD